MRLRKATKSDRLRLMTLRLQGVSKELAKVIIKCERIIALDYKDWFEIPNVKVETSVKTRDFFGEKVKVVLLRFSINGRRIQGWAEYSDVFLYKCFYGNFPNPMDRIFTNKLTRVINAISPRASRKKELAKKTIETHFKVKVKEK